MSHCLNDVVSTCLADSKVLYAELYGKGGKDQPQHGITQDEFFASPSFSIVGCTTEIWWPSLTYSLQGDLTHNDANNAEIENLTEK